MPTLRSEASIQRSVMDYAKKKGCLCKKLSVQGPMGNSGWPDYMILFHGSVYFIEFKKPGGKATPLQLELIAALRFHGFSADVVDSVDDGRGIVDRLVR